VITFIKEKVNFNDNENIQPLHIYRGIVIARTGKQDYLESEIVDGGSNKIVSLYRLDKDVEESAKLLNHLPIVEEHPQKPMEFSDATPILGVVTNARFEDGKVLADLVFYKTPSNKEFSLGYSADVVLKDGKYIQTKIKPNHLAVVERSRCGIICSLTKKNKRIKNMQINFNDKAHEVTDEVGAYIAVLEANQADTENKLKKAFNDGLIAEKTRASTIAIAQKRGISFKDTDKVEDIKMAIAKDLGIDVTGKSKEFIDGIIATSLAIGETSAPSSILKDEAFDYDKLEMGV
jgi:hypothetical protein